MTAGAPWGADADDWEHFSERLGLTADLLPVVSNPAAKISPMSKMKDLGKTPSRYDGGGLVVGIPKWTQVQATTRDVGRWSQQSDYGICLQTRRMRAIDIDIADPARAAEVRETIELMLDLPVRMRANSGKCLLLLDMPGDFAKRVIRTPHGIIEFLATGQQFIAVGTHPSGARYEWEGGMSMRVPVVTPAEFEVLWQALVVQFALPDGAHTARNGMVPAVPRLASDLQDAAVAWLHENDWVTSFERDGRVDVRCPWEDGHSTDSGPSSTSYFPAGVGGFAQGHFRCLHASCTSRTDGDFFEAVGYGASDFEVLPAVVDPQGEEERPLPPFARDRGGRIEAELNNVLMLLRRSDLLKLRIGTDAFKGVLMLGEKGAWRPFEDDDYTMLRSVFAVMGFKPVSPEMMKDAVRFVGREQQFDSAKQWAATLVWDGVPRVTSFFATYFGTEDNDYTRAVARYTWSALAGRCMVPGVKADMAPVLIGLQGAGKTSAVEVFSPIKDAFVEIALDRKDDDIARSLRGKLVGEIAELKGIASRDAESIKAWVSRRTEEWTPKYREFVTRFDRRLLCIGTGNKDEFLDDETGERRWLPMVVGVVDVKGIEAVRDQLWAEGIQLFEGNGNEVLWREAYTLAKLEHGKFKVSDSWEEPIADWLAREDMDGPRADQPIRLVDVLLSALGFSVQKITRKDELRVGKVLLKLGYEKRVRRVGGRNAKVWVCASDAALEAKGEFDELA